MTDPNVTKYLRDEKPKADEPAPGNMQAKPDLENWELVMMYAGEARSRGRLKHADQLNLIAQRMRFAVASAAPSFDLDTDLCCGLEEVQRKCRTDDPLSFRDRIIEDWLAMHRELTIHAAKERP